MPADMKCVRRISVEDEFDITGDDPIPCVPIGGARVKVLYAGVCYTNKQVQRTGKRRPKMAGVHDTSLFPGYEVSGVIDAICNTVEGNKFKVGEKVIVYPEDEDLPESGYAEYIAVKDVQHLIRVPDTLPMEVAAMLPAGGLIAYNAVMRVKPIVDEMVRHKKEPISILVVGAGGLALWLIRLAKKFLCTDCGKVRVIVADANIEKLMVAKEHGCAEVIHWNNALHEEYLLERTKNACSGGVNVLIDFVSSQRTITRGLEVLTRDGMIVVGGNAKYEVSLCMHSIASKQQIIMGVSLGSPNQLRELVDIMAAGQVTPPAYSIFPVDEANKVFDQLNSCTITGRAVLQVGSHTSCEESASTETKQA